MPHVDVYNQVYKEMKKNLKKFNIMKKTMLLLLFLFLFITCGASSGASLPEESIHTACKGNVEQLKSLLKADPSLLNNKGGGGLTLLHFASWCGSKQAVEFLISQGADVMSRSDNGETPLHYASLSVNVDVIKSLISRRADVNSKNSSGETPLHYAVGSKRKEAVELLLIYGADINATDERGKTPLSTVVEIRDSFGRFFPPSSDRKEMINVLFAHGARINNLTEAIAAGDLDTIKSLIASDPQLLNSANRNDGETPLWSAAYWDRREAVELLISLGAKVNGIWNDGAPLWVSSMIGSSEITELLISAGADVNLGSRTPLFSAVYYENSQIFFSYLDHEGKKNSCIFPTGTDNNAEDYLKVARLLIAAGADVNVKNRETPLHIAVIKNWKEMAELLISAGADVNSREDEMQSTPLHFAAEDGSRELVELLISKGADINAKDKNGKTPLKLALENNRNVVIVLLRRLGAKE